MAKPIVSVVIPVRNESRYIAKCLESVSNQDFSKTKMELILVDGCSEDDTVAQIQEFAKVNPWVRVLSNPYKTVQYALNIGMQDARGTYLVRMDAHSEYASDYITACVQALENTDAVNVGGPMIAKGKNLKQKVIAAAYHSSFALGGGRFHRPNFEGYADTVFLGAFRKADMEEMGYYDEQLPRSEDDDLNFRFSEQGKKIYITPKIRSVYYPRDSFLALFAQYFEYGMWKVAVIKKHRRPARITHLVPAAFVAFLLLGAISACFCLYAAIAYFGILAIYLLMDFIVSFGSLLAKGFVQKLLLCYVHIILHISYGIGFWVGIFRFMGKKFQNPNPKKEGEQDGQANQSTTK